MEPNSFIPSRLAYIAPPSGPGSFRRRTRGVGFSLDPISCDTSSNTLREKFIRHLLYGFVWNRVDASPDEQHGGGAYRLFVRDMREIRENSAKNPLRWAGPVFHDREGGVRGEARVPQFPRDGFHPGNAHVDGEGPVLRQAIPFDGAAFFPEGLVPRDEGDGRGHAAVGERDPGRRGAPDGRRDAGNDLELHAFPCEMLRLLASPSEDERVSGFQADNGSPFPRQPHRRLVDGDLFQRGPVPRRLPLPGIAEFQRFRWGQREDLLRDEVVVDDRVRAAQQAKCAHGEEIRIPRPRADDVDLPLPGRDPLAPPAPLQADRDFLPVLLEELPQGSGRPGVFPAGGDGQREFLLLKDGRKDEGAQLRGVRDVDRDVPADRLPGHLGIHAPIVRCREDEGGPVEVAWGESALDRPEIAAPDPFRNRPGELFRDHGDDGAPGDQRADLAGRDRSATHDQRIRPADVVEQREIFDGSAHGSLGNTPNNIIPIGMIVYGFAEQDVKRKKAGHTYLFEKLSVSVLRLTRGLEKI